ncbi:putative protein [Arabidopsis thaliana]|uniref:Uncharacterized protein T21L8.80 n=1 Tax=Arabidopsis thaliana TaxID=3702 RepID=Q9STY9_ARATH|nr:putative protein [Arabidopsis thaliana]
MARVKDSSGEYESTRVETTGEIPPSVEETAAEIPQRDEEGAELLTTEEEAGEIQPTTGGCDAADLGNSNAVAWESIDDLSDPNADSCAEEEEATNAVVQHDDGANKDDGDDDNLPQNMHDGDDDNLPQNMQDDDDDDDDNQPLPPEVMYFDPTTYTKVCKIGTRCQLVQTVEFIETLDEELKWFRNHDQFKHIFHMPKEPNHMIQGMWMLMVRTAKTELARECWFVVNGVPIRYSIREHALLTGLNCREYPKNNKTLGSLKFVEKLFKRTEDIKIKDVEEKLEEFKSEKSTARLKLAILLFLAKVMKADSKGDSKIEELLLRIVDNVRACETFPWGRFSFEQCMEGVQRVMKNMKGVVKPKTHTAFYGFITPLKILAFECIPQLGKRFREAVPANKECSRMCKHKFNESCMKGFSLEEINEALGDITDISSILEPDMDERKMLSRVVEKHVDDGIGYIDPIVDSWRERLIVEKKKIFWRSLYQADIDGRRIETVDDVPAVPEPEIPGTSILSFKEAMERGFDKLTDKLAVMDSEIKRICVRVQGIEEYVADQLEKEAEKARYEDIRPGSAADFVPLSYQPRDTQSKALVIHSGIRDPAPPTIESLSDGSDESDEEDKKKQISKKKRKHVGPTLESGEKRGRKPFKYKGEEFTAEGKQTRKRQKN